VRVLPKFILLIVLFLFCSLWEKKEAQRRRTGESH
jgi:hypothetical protein